MESKQENNKQRKQRQVIYFCCTKLSLREGFTSGSNPRPTQYCFFSFYIRALKYVQMYVPKWTIFKLAV